MAACGSFMRVIKFSRGVVLAVSVVSLAVAARGEPATNSYNFTGPEIYPIDAGISLLHAADLNGDGLNDLIVVNNLRTKINLLYNQTGKTNRIADATASRKLDLNELPPDARFRIDSIPAAEHITAMV